MPSTNKLRHFKRSQLRPQKRGLSGVRARNRLTKAQVEHEHELLQQLSADAQFRATQMGLPWSPADPILVWGDLEQFRDQTLIGSEQLKPWRKVGQYLKLHLLFRVTVIAGGYSFTAKVRPDLEARWLRHGRSPSERISKLISNGLSELGLGKLPLSYVIEGKGRRGFGNVGLHIHGFVQTTNPHVSTKLKVMFEQKFACHPKGKAAAGLSLKAGEQVKFEPIYDAGCPEHGTAGRWASYIAKNAMGLDKRLEDKRIFMSKEGIAIAREFWSLLRNDF